MGAFYVSYQLYKPAHSYKQVRGVCAVDVAERAVGTHTGGLPTIKVLTILGQTSEESSEKA